MIKTCDKTLARGQWWNYCGECDIDSAPVQCIECNPENGLALYEDENGNHVLYDDYIKRYLNQ